MSDAIRFENQVVIVTGAGGGLGRAHALLFAKHGAKVVVNDLGGSTHGEGANASAADKVVAEIKAFGGEAVANHDSVTDGGQIVQCALDSFGRIDVVVNNAGINIRKPIEEMVKDEWMKMMEVNTASVFLATKYVLPVMRKQGGGAIINTSSICGLIGHMNTPEAYTATKGAITLLTKSVAARYGKDNIRCNSIHPATVDTPFVAALMADPVKKQARLNEIPLGRLTSVEDVANAVLYLASDEASFLNGVNLPIDGGVTCY